jgi:predicted Zn-ribbon and HTH transcriptional regulator
VSDLIAFIERRLDEDERLARDALHPDAVSPGEWVTEQHGTHSEPNRCHIAEDRRGHYWSVAFEVFIPNAEHMARHDPARVLREVEAKRRVLARHHEESHVYGQICRGCGFEGDNEDPRNFIDECEELRDLASVWSDHPDYRTEWSPA